MLALAFRLFFLILRVRIRKLQLLFVTQFLDFFLSLHRFRSRTQLLNVDETLRFVHLSVAGAFPVLMLS
jgi:hypothetical protein